MIRLLIFLAVIVGLGFLFSWVADTPGNVTVAFQGQEHQVSLMTAAVVLVGTLVAIMVLWSAVSAILRSPAIMSRFFKSRKRERGYSSLSKGLIAASSGDAAAARRLAKESGKLLTDEPLVKLLDAQTSLLEGDRTRAREVYADMLGDDQTKLVALRGLYLEAEREGSGEAARHYADEAVKKAPALPWAGNAKLQFQAQDNDWEETLNTLEVNRAAGLVSKEDAKYQRAVLLTALAYQEEGADPARAAKHAQAAHKLMPDFVPAAVIGAQAYARNNDIRRASKLIEAVWKREPHPELADAYMHLRAGDSVQDRLQRASDLDKLKANHPEGAIAMAIAAIDANDWALAREKMKPVITSHLTERACLIMADIEEGESGDRGRMRDWLARAVRAPRDPVWTADGFTSETWMPVSPVTGEIGAFEWKVPTERLNDTGAAIEIGDLAEPLVLEPLASETSQEAESTTTVEMALAGAGMAASNTAASAEPIVVELEDVADAEVIEDTPTVDDAVKVELDASENDQPEEDAVVVKSSTEEEKQESLADDLNEPDVTVVTIDDDDATDPETKAEESDDQDGDTAVVLELRPDDPGVREADKAELETKKKRFGLF